MRKPKYKPLLKKWNMSIRRKGLFTEIITGGSSIIRCAVITRIII